MEENTTIAVDDEENDEAPEEAVLHQQPPTCSICNIHDPEAEHCDLCGVCIYYIDHHCVFFGKCVAGNNIDYFTHSICLFLMSCFYFMLLISLDGVWTQELKHASRVGAIHN
jgi:hypothetical protein